ncbi:hypothetical protein MBANPS3_012259 [Mucor bainieri]
MNKLDKEKRNTVYQGTAKEQKIIKDKAQAIVASEEQRKAEKKKQSASPKASPENAEQPSSCSKFDQKLFTQHQQYLSEVFTENELMTAKQAVEKLNAKFPGLWIGRIQADSARVPPPPLQFDHQVHMLIGQNYGI